MFEHTLAQSGLNANQATVYEVLLKEGRISAGNVAKKVPLKRGLVYKVLDELAGFGVVAKKEEPGKAALFEVTHPYQLKELISRKEQEVKDARSALESVLPAMISAFNQISGKPGVLFYEGRAGIQEVLNDSLTSREEILSYADIESVVKYIDDINKAYVAKREELKLKKRGILLDTQFTRQYLASYHTDVTETRLIKFLEAPPFQSIMQMYDNKISYVTLSPDRMIGVVIEDPHLYQMHKYLFEYTWKEAYQLT